MSATTKHLLIVYHSQSGSTARMAEAVIDGARDDAFETIIVRARDALAASADDVLWADAILLGTPENFGYMSGALKYFFDRIYYPCLEHSQGLGYGLFIKAGNDGQGALTAIERIIKGLGWRTLAAPVIVVGDVDPAHLEACRELGMTFAAGLDAGLF
jgi:multimeric flavodoxin WrbA